MFKLNAKFDVDSLLYLVILNTTDMQYTCSLNSATPPMTSTVKSSLFTHAHSTPLSLVPGNIDVAQTVLVILTMAGIFLDRPHVYLIFKNHYA